MKSSWRVLFVRGSLSFLSRLGKKEAQTSNGGYHKKLSVSRVQRRKNSCIPLLGCTNQPGFATTVPGCRKKSIKAKLRIFHQNIFLPTLPSKKPHQTNPPKGIAFPSSSKFCKEISSGVDILEILVNFLSYPLQKC